MHYEAVIHSAALSAAALTLTTAAPAFAEEYYYDGSGDAVGALFGTGVCGVYACLGVFGILSLVFWIWMLVDLFARQEYEFPNSTGNSKTIWLIVMFASWVIGAALVPAIVYYFMVFKKIKRGQGGQPPMAGPTGGYQPPAAPMAPPPAPPAPPAAPVAPPAPPAPPTPPAPPAPPV